MFQWLVRLFSQGRPAPVVGRNAPCPCGSGRKFKRCCIHRAERSQLEQLNSAIPSDDQVIGGRATVANHALERANRYRMPKP